MGKWRLQPGGGHQGRTDLSEQEQRPQQGQVIQGHDCQEEEEKVFGFSLQRAEYMEVMTHIGQKEVDILQSTMALEADGLLWL